MAKTAKNKTVRLPKSYDMSQLGEEPSWDENVVPTQSEIIRALNWYHYFYDQKKAVELLFKNYVRDLREIDLLKRLPEIEIPPTVCFYSRMKNIGCKFSETSTDAFNATLDRLVQNARALKQQEDKSVSKKTVVSIQDRVLDKAREYMGEFEHQIDLFFENGYKSTFSAYNYLKENEVKPLIAKKMIGVFDSLIEELNEVLLKKDVQLVEAYSHMKPLHVRKFIAFLETVHGDIVLYCDNGKKVRKPRKKKPVAISKQLDKLQYMKECSELKLASIDPSKIIGASQLWVYNVKYRKLTRYLAADKAGFSIKGTTLQNVSDDSVVKMVKKPTEVLTKVLDGGKIALRRLMNDLNTKGSIPTGRINKETILLKVL